MGCGIPLLTARSQLLIKFKSIGDNRALNPRRWAPPPLSVGSKLFLEAVILGQDGGGVQAVVVTARTVTKEEGPLPGEF